MSKSSPQLTFFVLWMLVSVPLIYWQYTQSSKPKPPEPVTIAPTQRIKGEAVSVAGNGYTARIDPDGTLVGFNGHRYAEDNLAAGWFLPAEYQKLVEARSASTTSPARPFPRPDLASGVFVGRLMARMPDSETKKTLNLWPESRRRSLEATVSTSRTAGSTVETVIHEVSDPEGRLLPKGVVVTRRFTPDLGLYRAHIEVSVANTGSTTADFTSDLDALYIAAGPTMVATGDMPEVFVRSATGVATVSPSADATMTSTGASWVGVRLRYYTTLLDAGDQQGRAVHQNLTLHTSWGESRVAPVVGFRLPILRLAPKAKQVVKYGFYCGIKQPDVLHPEYSAVFNGWDGITGFIGHGMFYVLRAFAWITGSWGLAILLLTLLVKAILHPLSHKQAESMRKMQELQPRMQALKETTKDPAELQQQMMALYQEHNVSPMGGCLPLLMQIPIFIALYSCLQGSIDLKGVSFWWMADLSKPDPSYLLPVLFALTMKLSSKMMQQPAVGDQAQQVAMMNNFMPVMMLFFMSSVPGGVMIYLSGQSLMGILENKWNMDRMAQAKARKLRRD